MERVNVKYANVWTKNNVEALLLKSMALEDAEDIWPLLWFVQLKNMPEYDLNTSKNLDDLDLMARQYVYIYRG